jgi:hypothetical protein
MGNHLPLDPPSRAESLMKIKRTKNNKKKRKKSRKSRRNNYWAGPLSRPLYPLVYKLIFFLQYEYMEHSSRSIGRAAPSGTYITFSKKFQKNSFWKFLQIFNRKYKYSNQFRYFKDSLRDNNNFARRKKPAPCWASANVISIAYKKIEK